MPIGVLGDLVLTPPPSERCLRRPWSSFWTIELSLPDSQSMRQQRTLDFLTSRARATSKAAGFSVCFEGAMNVSHLRVISSDAPASYLDHRNRRFS
jgi:hypothetical protein